MVVVAPRRKQAPACRAHNKPHLCSKLFSLETFCSKLFALDWKAKFCSVLLAFFFSAKFL